MNAPLADGTYDFRVVLGGTTNTLSGVNVKQGTLVTFPTVQLTVTLANASGPVVGRERLGEEQRRVVVVDRDHGKLRERHGRRCCPRSTT